MFWLIVVDLYMCEYNAENGHVDDDCLTERDYLENERWLQPDAELMPPPGQNWPPSFLNFILSLVYAWSYVPIDYELMYKTDGCGGLCDVRIAVSGTSSGYLSDSWEPEKGPTEGCGHLSGTACASSSRCLTTSMARLRPPYPRRSSTASAKATSPAALRKRLPRLETYVSPNDLSTWCSEADYTWYALN